jgi:MFS transporter, DHA1 family, multidrug resistance protein
MYAASALAGHTIIRSATGAAFPLFTTQMFVNLGTNWAATVLGGIALVLAPIPFLFYKYGSRIRTKSSFAPCIDLKVAKFLEEERAAAEKGQQSV